MNDRLVIRCIVSLEEMLSLKLAWTDLVGRMRDDNIFLSWEWVYVWCKHYLGDRKLCVVVFSEGEGRVVGIAPFYIETVRLWSFKTVRRLRFLGTEEVCPAYLDFIVDERHKRAVVRTFYQWLYGKMSSLWDVAVLSELPAESLTVDYISELIERDGKCMEATDLVASPGILLPKTVQEFLSSIGGSERYNLQRKRKRLNRAGFVSVYRVNAESEFNTAMDCFVGLHQTRWEGKGYAGAFKQTRFQAFHQEIGKLLASKGISCIDLLRLNGEPIAGVYGYSYRGRYSFYLPGLNHHVVPEASPGTLLLYHCVERAIAEGVKEFDLLCGVMPYKLAWANMTRRCVTVTFYNRHLGGVIASLDSKLRDFGKVLLR